MRMEARVPPSPQLFSPHPNLSDAINHNIVQSEIEGGVYLADLPPESSLEIETKNHFYTLLGGGQGEVLISGHPDFCPVPVAVRILGSNWGGSMLKVSFIGRGTHLEFLHPRYQRPIITSRIREIREIPCDERSRPVERTIRHGQNTARMPISRSH